MLTTNVMRILESSGIRFTSLEYEWDEEDLSGVHAAQVMGLSPETVFKTLVARGDKTGLSVFVIPVAEELDLKKCARASGNRAVEMIHVKELKPLTGYERGGCSPIGMKKNLPTFIDETALLLDEIAVSGGKRGVQIKLSPEELMRVCGARSADLIVY
ncbi:MAG: Cys-tRNA(Pro) deacylase [Clostridiales bacterium]|nr:Cys-tRNA(Pro) deacylase [Clostridiales bacterium]